MAIPIKKRLRPGVWAAQPIIRNLAWLGGVELVIRVLRIASMIAIARLVDPESFGLAALVLSTHELVKVGAQLGTGQSIIRSSDEDLARTCETAWRLNWVVCFLLAVIQVLVAAVIARSTNTPYIFFLGATLALVFLGMPFGLVQVFRALRQQRADKIARLSAAQSLVDIGFSLILAIMGLGVVALVLPKVISMPIWVIGARRSDSWRRDPGVAALPISPMMRFGVPILLSEGVNATRMHADKIIIGASLSLDDLGIWFVASSAGLGLAQAVASAISQVVLPHLCSAVEEQEPVKQFDRLVKTTVLPLSLVFVVQSALAPIYVPILFGETWRDGAIIVCLLCLTGLSRTSSEAAAQLARAYGRSGLDALTNGVGSVIVLAALWFGAAYGLTEAALAYTISTLLTQAITVVVIRLSVASSMSRASRKGPLTHAI